MHIVVATRRAHVPLVQAKAVVSLLEAAGHEAEIRPIDTVGDALNVALTEQHGGVFVRDLDEALCRGEVDIVVHDAKDLGPELSRGTAIAAIPQRLDAREAFVSTRVRKLSALTAGMRVGVSGPCRDLFWARVRPDLVAVPLSGDAETRLKSLSAGEVDALILAAAALIRLNVARIITDFLPVDRFVPGVGQGALAIVARSQDKELIKVVMAACHHQASGMTIRAERAFQKQVARGLSLAAHAEIEPAGLKMHAFIADRSRQRYVAVKLGAALAKKMMEKM